MTIDFSEQVLTYGHISSEFSGCLLLNGDLIMSMTQATTDHTTDHTHVVTLDKVTFSDGTYYCTKCYLSVISKNLLWSETIIWTRSLLKLQVHVLLSNLMLDKVYWWLCVWQRYFTCLTAQLFKCCLGKVPVFSFKCHVIVIYKLLRTHQQL